MALSLKDDPQPNKCLGVFGLSLRTTERDLKEVFFLDTDQLMSAPLSLMLKLAVQGGLRSFTSKIWKTQRQQRRVVTELKLMVDESV